MYTHARQFPHLAGLSDEQIRAISRRALGRRPDLVRLLLLRNVGLVALMALATVLLTRLSGLEPGLVLIIVGGTATAAVLSWNLVWVNTVLFRLTREEVGRGPA